MSSLIGRPLLVVGALAAALMLAGCAGTSGTAVGTSTPPPSTAVGTPVPNGGEQLINASGSQITLNGKTVNPNASTSLPDNGTIGLPSGTYTFNVDDPNFTFDGQTKNAVSRFAGEGADFKSPGKYNLQAQSHNGSMYVWVNNP